ncbi:hypothetical protein RBG61_10575 [Paludicola sp. MB14-C6]|uniref:hypothetical protein n=1 Tax=Paludihabitans sp. MB14-C6 TaxID=3070656 RepID=UPI0027DBA61A|nr:hypothetical protein [Paludicola sp. MB14-C6]WMJ22427.1 hypothetical protein RBG61_10575 [Paludicola sp. MB14-C6]
MIFKKKLSFYSSNLDCYIKNLKEGDLGYLSFIFCVFSEDSDKHKLKAAQVLNEILNELSFDDLCRTDIRMRETTSMEWSINWRALNIKDFITKEMSENEKRAVLIFASFNPNGYIREQAIKALLAHKETLSFILLRCNDWVYQVRQSALLLLSKRLINASDGEIVNALPLMEKLRRSERCEYSSILSIVVSTFDSDKSLIEKGLNSNDVRARRFCISILGNMPKVDGKCLLTHIRHEQDPFLRQMVFQLLLKTNVNLEELSKQFLKDKYPPNRILALQFLYDYKTDIAIDVSENMLMDKNAQVRALARSIISKSERIIDVRQLYIDNLSADAVVSLLGLGEVGIRDDCNLIETYLVNDCISIIRAAMSALMRLDSATFISHITEMLLSEHVGVVKTATLLLKNNKGYDFERIFQLQGTSSNENTKVKCATLLFLSSKWQSLIYSLTLLDSDYEKLEILCHAQINRWISSYNRSYAVSSENEKQRIKELLIEKKTFLTPEIENQLFFLSK